MITMNCGSNESAYIYAYNTNAARVEVENIGSEDVHPMDINGQWLEMKKLIK